MAEFNVRLASKGEIRGISDWFLEERSKYPGMAQLVGRGVRGWMVRSVVTPRYLRKVAYTYVLEQDGQTGGFAVVEQGGLAVNLSDFAIREGFDRAGLVRAMLAQVEQLALEREYHLCARNALGFERNRIGAFLPGRLSAARLLFVGVYRPNQRHRDAQRRNVGRACGQ